MSIWSMFAQYCTTVFYLTSLCHIKSVILYYNIDFENVPFSISLNEHFKRGFSSAWMWRLLWMFYILPFIYMYYDSCVVILYFFEKSKTYLRLDKIKFSLLNMFNMVHFTISFWTPNRFLAFYFDVWHVYTVLNAGGALFLVVR